MLSRLGGLGQLKQGSCPRASTCISPRVLGVSSYRRASADMSPCSYSVAGINNSSHTPQHSSHSHMSRHRVSMQSVSSSTPSSTSSSCSGTSSVRVENLRLSFKNGTSVLNGVNLSVKRGSLHMLLGPNGCGKSTLLKTLGGLLEYSSGSMYVDTPTGFVFQNPDHQVVMPTVAADVAFGLGRYRMDEKEVEQVVMSSLELVNMQDCMYRAAHTLSGGQRQRVAIAGALAEKPKLLLLDELTTFLDVEDQLGVLQAVRKVTHADADVTAIWVTHRFEEMEYADSVSYMKAGRITFTGSPEEMRSFLRKEGAPI